MFRAQFPADFDRTRESQILELLAVFVRQSTQLMGNQSGISPKSLAGSFEDLFEKPMKTEDDILAAIAAYEKG